MVVSLYSPDKSRDALFISNYANIQIKDVLTRVDGVGSITVFGSRDYAMQVWLDPDRLQSLNLTAHRRHAGAARRRTSRSPPACSTSRRCRTSSRSRSRCGRSGAWPTRTSSATSSSSRPRNAVVRLHDVARVELTAQDYSSNSYLDRNDVGRARGLPAAGLERADDRRQHRQDDGGDLEELPAGPRIRHRLQSDPVHPAVGRAVVETIFEAVLLVVRRDRAVPADLARGGHPAPRDPDLADRHVLHR